MKTYLELSLQRDIERIRGKVSEMARLAEQALQDCLEVLVENNRKLAYTIILRDQHINEKEKEIDRLCLEFLVRQQPVALPLRFAYSTIKINLEIERIGDYAESIARQWLKSQEQLDEKLKGSIVQLTKIAIGMFHDASEAFVEQDPEMARKCIEAEEAVDALRTELNNELVAIYHDKKISFEMLDLMLTIVRRVERVSDQARNICMEVLYMCTGEYAKHPGSEFFRVLFVDQTNSCCSQIAEAIAHELKQYKFIFSSAGVEPLPVNQATLDFMKTKGFDLSRTAPKAVHQIPHLDHYQIIIALDEAAHRAFPKKPGKIVFLDWKVFDPSKIESAEEKDKAFETTYQFLKGQIEDLVQALSGTENR